MRFIHFQDKSFFPVICKSFFWFLVGVFLGFFFLVSFAFILFQRMYTHVIYPGVTIDSVNFGGRAQSEVKDYFDEKNKKIAETQFIFKHNSEVATISAKELDYGYNSDLLSKQAFTIGRSNDITSNISLVFQAYLNNVELKPSYSYSEQKLDDLLLPLVQKLKIEPNEALFSFENGRVVAFRLSSDGQEADLQAVKNRLAELLPVLAYGEKKQTITVNIPLKVLKPKMTTDKANNLGIVELIGSGTSLFRHSIPGRIYNITLAASRLNGILVAPNEIFSFDQALGDVSSFTGYKQAYIIQNGRTILGDGGGVCQVSTTFFRALLAAGLPILERQAHAYRVEYYEQDSPPGIDATIYVPTVDLKFKNDTSNYILIQSMVDQDSQRITFFLYGKKDGREVSMTTPVISSQTPPPEPLYQDDPTLPKGTTKQVDFSAWGANVSFSRTVTKNNKTIISEKYVSNYRPWQTVYLRGTKE